MKQRIFFSLLFFLLSQTDVALGASCNLVPPMSSATGEDIGFIMIPGAQIAGEQYQDLGEEIQRQLPGARVWLGLTKGWLGNFPNPIEIAGALNDCLAHASSEGLAGPVFMAGHSLGGIMLETYIKDHPDVAAGIILLGSYLPDLFGDHSNVFPVPVLTAVGELDGLTLSYVYREWMESADAGVLGGFPVYVIDDANHAQVASGDIPSFVTEQDIPSPISFEEAHQRYAQAVACFIVRQKEEMFSEDQLIIALETQSQLMRYSSRFLVPFATASLMETDGAEVPSSSWMLEGQRVLLAASEEELTNLEVIDFVVPFEDLGDAKPGVNSSTECQALVSTFSQPQYDSSVADANTLQSASVIKAKFKLEDVVRESLCLPEVPRKQCMDINIAAFDMALSLATDEARERFLAIGTELVFDNDKVSPWGPGWEFSFGLHYAKINETHTRLYSTSLISEPDFFIPTAAGMHYCDLLSPFRALEWIYITGVQGKTI
jgi:dienelactone hydrolase